MLAAAIKVLREDLNIKRIFYHSFESGNILKGFEGDWLPPRSLYTQLPKRFCFQPTNEAPAMLAHELERMRGQRLVRRGLTFNKLEW